MLVKSLYWWWLPASLVLMFTWWKYHCFLKKQSSPRPWCHFLKVTVRTIKYRSKCNTEGFQLDSSRCIMTKAPSFSPSISLETVLNQEKMQILLTFNIGRAAILNSSRWRHDSNFFFIVFEKLSQSRRLHAIFAVCETKCSSRSNIEGGFEHYFFRCSKALENQTSKKEIHGSRFWSQARQKFIIFNSVCNERKLSM